MSWENKFKLVQDRAEVATTKGNHTAMDTPGVLDHSNPRALINIVPEGVKPLLEKLPEKYMMVSERVLEKVLKPDPMLNRIRLAFWKEYDLAQGEVRKMSWLGITKMVQRPSVMIRNVMAEELNLAWILCPPANYDVFLEEALQHGMDRIREILDLPIVNEEGKVDTRVGELILKAAAFLDLRRHGGFVQKSVNVDVGVGYSERQMKHVGEKFTLEDVSSKIKALEQELGMKREQDAIDVTE